MLINIGKLAEEAESGQIYQAVDRVILHNSDSEYRSPNVPETAWDNMTGCIVEAECNYASQAVADAILQRLAGLAYQPFFSSGATLNPAAELGDTVEVDGIESIIGSADITLDARHAADISAPGGEETHEYPYVSAQERQVRRNTEKQNQLRADITAMNGQIALVVEKTTEGYVIKSASIITAINDDGSSIKLSADKIDLNGIVQVAKDLMVGTQNDYETSITMGKGDGLTVLRTTRTEFPGFAYNYFDTEIDGMITQNAKHARVQMGTTSEGEYGDVIVESTQGDLDAILASMEIGHMGQRNIAISYDGFDYRRIAAAPVLLVNQAITRGGTASWDDFDLYSMYIVEASLGSSSRTAERSTIVIPAAAFHASDSGTPVYAISDEAAYVDICPYYDSSGRGWIKVTNSGSSSAAQAVWGV